jgi:glycosyltransferase involved in cell wall biosynthesis
LIPSQARETSSLIAMEAMAAGTPVIAWRSGALPEIVADQRTGFIVSSVDQMCDAIQQVSSLDLSVCRSEAESRFSSGQMVSSYLGLYRALVTPAPARELQAA